MHVDYAPSAERGVGGTRTSGEVVLYIHKNRASRATDILIRSAFTQGPWSNLWDVTGGLDTAATLLVGSGSAAATESESNSATTTTTTAGIETLGVEGQGQGRAYMCGGAGDGDGDGIGDGDRDGDRLGWERVAVSPEEVKEQEGAQLEFDYCAKGFGGRVAEHELKMYEDFLDEMGLCNLVARVRVFDRGWELRLRW